MKNNENNREKKQNNRTGWLEDFDPTASGSRTSTRPPEVLQRGTTTGKYNGETKRETKWKNEKTKKIEKSHL